MNQPADVLDLKFKLIDVKPPRFEASRGRVHPLQKVTLSWDVEREDGVPVSDLRLLGYGPVPAAGSVELQLAQTTTFRLEFGPSGARWRSHPVTVSVDPDGCSQTAIPVGEIRTWIAEPAFTQLLAEHPALTRGVNADWSGTEVTAVSGVLFFTFRFYANLPGGSGIGEVPFKASLGVVASIDPATRTARYAIDRQFNHWGEGGDGMYPFPVPAAVFPSPVDEILDERNCVGNLRRILTDRLDEWFRWLNIKKPKQSLAAIRIDDGEVTLVRCLASGPDHLPLR